MDTVDIAFIGGGNLAASLVGGLIADGYPAAAIRVADPDPARRERLAARWGVQVHEDNAAAARGAAVLVLAVKPQVVPAVARELGPLARAQGSLVVSVAAGVRTRDLARWLGFEAPLVRAMPNTPALVQSGASGLYATPGTGEAERERAESLLRAVGVTVWVEDEDLMDAVTAVSGSGPAYFFLLMEALAEAGERLGLEAGQARLLALETAFGAAKMALEASEPPAALRARVTSPGGTTERALGVLEEGGFRELVSRAVAAARERARELADLLGREP